MMKCFHQQRQLNFKKLIKPLFRTEIIALKKIDEAAIQDSDNAMVLKKIMKPRFRTATMALKKLIKLLFRTVTSS